MEINELLLLSRNDIPFPQGQLTVHQPTLKEIAYIGETNFFMGCELLNFSKENLLDQDKTNLTNQTDFNVLMVILNDRKNAAFASYVISANMVLTLMFPQYRIQIEKQQITFVNPETHEQGAITNDNFNEFKDLVTKIFGLKSKKSEESYNPKGDLAKKIADKINKSKKKIAEEKGKQNKKIAIYSRYVSILSVAENKDINTLMQYSVYQLLDEFTRFEMKQQYDTYFQAKLAGAKDLKDVDNWMKDIHEI